MSQEFKPAVQFTDQILEFNHQYIRPGMRAFIINMRPSETSDKVVVVLHFEDFAKFNEQLETPVIIGTKPGSWWHPKYDLENPWIEEIEIDLDEADSLMRVISSETVELMQEYFDESPVDRTYVEWLEDIVLGVTSALSVVAKTL